MDYKEKLSELYLILKETFSDDIKYTKEKDYLYLECKGIESPNYSGLTLKMKIKYDDLMMNEMMWAYCAGETPDDHYVLRKDTLDSIAKSLQSVVGGEMFNSDYLNTLQVKDNSVAEAKNTLYLKVINEINNLELGHWAVYFMNTDNDYLLLPVEKGLLNENFNLTIDVLNTYDTLKMLELKQVLKHDNAYNEILRVKDVLKRLL